MFPLLRQSSCFPYHCLSQPWEKKAHFLLVPSSPTEGRSVSLSSSITPGYMRGESRTRGDPVLESGNAKQCVGENCRVGDLTANSQTSLTEYTTNKSRLAVIFGARSWQILPQGSGWTRGYKTSLFSLFRCSEEWQWNADDVIVDVTTLGIIKYLHQWLYHNHHHHYHNHSYHQQYFPACWCLWVCTEWGGRNKSPKLNLDPVHHRSKLICHGCGILPITQ